MTVSPLSSDATYDATSTPPPQTSERSAEGSGEPHAQPRRKRRRRRRKRTTDKTAEQTAKKSPQDASSSSSSRQAPAKRARSKRISQKSQSAERRDHQRRESPEAMLRRAVELIDSVAREEAQQRGVMRLSTLHLNLTIGEGESSDARPSSAQVTRQIDKLQEQITGQVRALVPTQFQRGTVYCFHTDLGVVPPTPDAVFTGYDQLGRPQWMSFLPFCLQLQLPNLAQLYDSPPRAVGVLMPAPIGTPPISEVTRGRVYEVLAQLVVGPLASHFRALSDEDVRHTLIAQVLLVQAPDQPLRVRFNLLGLNPDELFDAAARSAPRAPISRARNSISAARHATRRLQEQHAQGRLSRARLLQESEQLLERLNEALLRSLSQNAQRTRHAQRRHQSMERPTSEAWRDAARAGDERLLWDTHQETIIVIGPKSRAHVFSPDGRHVTSVRLGVGELDRKRGQRRWLLLEPERASAFRVLIRGDAP